MYLSDGCRLKAYSATTKGEKSVVKIEIEVTGSYELGSFLSSLAHTAAEQKAAEKAASRKKPLAIEDMRERP